MTVSERSIQFDVEKKPIDMKKKHNYCKKKTEKIIE